MELEKNLKIIKSAILKSGQYNRILAKLYFDFDCLCPKDGRQQASEDMQIMDDKAFKLTHNPRYFHALEYLYQHLDKLEDYDQILIKQLYKGYRKNKNITPELNKALSLCASKNRIDWLNAKEKSDYSLFQDGLKKIVTLNQQRIQCRDEIKDSIYDTMLDDYEEGCSISFLDDFFAKLKKELLPLLQQVNQSKVKINEEFLSRHVPIYKQEEFSRYLLKIEGHDFNTLVLATTEHPFTESCGDHDERVTTHYYEDNAISNMYSILHEGGHALFDLNEPEEFKKHHINQNMSMAMHECMSRFFENYIGRSKEFIHLIYPEFIRIMDEFSDIREEELYQAINVAKPSLIRTEADELTYPFHIMIRYELEKEMINQDIDFASLNQKWNQKYKEYLNIDVPNDKEGILQDGHWCDSFGYFPSYALGSVYGAQIYHKMDADINIKQCILNNDIHQIVTYFKEHVWNIASISTPEEWIQKVTGESLNCQYYIDYLKKKYKDIYHL